MESRCLFHRAKRARCSTRVEDGSVVHSLLILWYWTTHDPTVTIGVLLQTSKNARAWMSFT
nr:hypothetical protein [Candidatus Sigynarchaeota archaeon]